MTREEDLVRSTTTAIAATVRDIPRPWDSAPPPGAHHRLA